LKSQVGVCSTRPPCHRKLTVVIDMTYQVGKLISLSFSFPIVSTMSTRALPALPPSGLVADIGVGAVSQLTLRAKTPSIRPPVVHCVVEERDQSRLETPSLLAVNNIAQDCPRDDIIGGANSGLSLGQIWCRSRHVGDNGTI